MLIDMGVDQQSLNRLTSALNQYPKECASGIVSAVNKSLHQVNTAMQKEITTRYNISKRELSGGSSFKSSGSNNLIRENKANYANLNASIEVRGSPLNAGARFLMGKKALQSRKGMTMRQIKRIKYPTVRIIKSQKKPMAAFAAHGRGGVQGIFVRDGEKIEMQKTLSTAQMASSDAVWKKTSVYAGAILNTKVEQELNYRLGKLGR